MKYISDLKPAARQPRQNTKVIPTLCYEDLNPPKEISRLDSSAPKRVIFRHFQRSYERYLVLARAEALTRDRIVAENYFQHAEHYFRAMREQKPNEASQQWATSAG